jgi:hypothetical protein
VRRLARCRATETPSVASLRRWSAATTRSDVRCQLAARILLRFRQPMLEAGGTERHRAAAELGQLLTGARPASGSRRRHRRSSRTSTSRWIQKARAGGEALAARSPDSAQPLRAQVVRREDEQVGQLALQELGDVHLPPRGRAPRARRLGRGGRRAAGGSTQRSARAERDGERHMAPCRSARSAVVDVHGVDAGNLIGRLRPASRRALPGRARSSRRGREALAGGHHGTDGGAR